MIPQNIYVPILKGKPAEFTALLKLDAEIKKDIIPIFEIFPDNKKTDDHVNNILKYFDKLNLVRAAYIDASMISKLGNISSGIHPLAHLFNNFRKKNLNVIPVFSNRTDIVYNAEILKITKKDQKGACIRVYKGIDDKISVNDKIKKLLSFIEIDPKQIDIIIDLEDLNEDNIESNYIWATKTINTLEYLNNWRSLALTGSSIPIDLSELTPEEIHVINRNTWKIWESIYNNNIVKRLPSYSDYGISHPQLLNIEIKTKEGKPAFPNVSASIRYTHEKKYYIYRGRGLRGNGAKQYYDQSDTLLNNPEFYGEDHCLGDDFIYKCGTIKKNPGNPMKWRWVGTVHHITVVVEQLRQFFLNFKV